MTYWNGGTLSQNTDTRHRGKWNWGRLLAILAQIIILAFYLKPITILGLIGALKDVNWMMLLTSIPVALVGVFIRSARRRIILRPIHHYPLSDLTSETIIAINKKLYHPERYVMRQLSQVLQRKSGVPGSVSIPYLLLDRVFDFTAGFLITLAAVCIAQTFSLGLRIFLVIGLILLNLIVATIFILAHYSRNKLRLGYQSPVPLKTAVRDVFPIICESLRMITQPIGRRKRDIPMAVLFTSTAIITDMITLFIAAKAVSLSMTLPVLFLYYAFLLIMWLLPGFPGFPGLADFLSLWFLRLLGVPLAVSAIPILIVHCVYVSGAIWVAGSSRIIRGIRDLNRAIGSGRKQTIPSPPNREWFNQSNREKATFLRKTTQVADDGVEKARL
ncbi:MAG: flippase-like domain-containing protein [Anaerolineales bacterium]|nr:flippase-like domain-containing protein [Anaerolineales bacterium]